MKKIDEQIKRIKELISEETLYGGKIDLIMESPLPSKLKQLFNTTDINLGKLRNELNSSSFIKNFKASEWANKVTLQLKKLKALPDITSNPKISEVNKILSENKKIMDDIITYFNTLELDSKIATSKNITLFNDISKNLPILSENIENTKRLLMLPSNKLKPDNLKFISEMTGYGEAGVKKLLSTISDTIKHLSNAYIIAKKIINTGRDWYTKDQNGFLLRFLQTLSPLNFNQAYRGKARGIKILAYLWAQGWAYGWLFKSIKCEFFGDKETNKLITSWGPYEKSLWEKYKINNLDKMIESLNSNPLISGSLDLITGGWTSILFGDCIPVDDKLLQKLVDDKAITPEQLSTIKLLGKSYLDNLLPEELKEEYKNSLQDAKDAIKTGGKEKFRDIFEADFYDEP